MVCWIGVVFSRLWDHDDSCFFPLGWDMAEDERCVDDIAEDCVVDDWKGFDDFVVDVVVSRGASWSKFVFDEVADFVRSCWRYGEVVFWV